MSSEELKPKPKTRKTPPIDRNSRKISRISSKSQPKLNPSRKIRNSSFQIKSSTRKRRRSIRERSKERSRTQSIGSNTSQFSRNSREIIFEHKVLMDQLLSPTSNPLDEIENFDLSTESNESTLENKEFHCILKKNLAACIIRVGDESITISYENQDISARIGQFICYVDTIDNTLLKIHIRNHDALFLRFANNEIISELSQVLHKEFLSYEHSTNLKSSEENSFNHMSSRRRSKSTVRNVRTIGRNMGRDIFFNTGGSHSKTRKRNSLFSRGSPRNILETGTLGSSSAPKIKITLEGVVPDIPSKLRNSSEPSSESSSELQSPTMPRLKIITTPKSKIKEEQNIVSTSPVEPQTEFIYKIVSIKYKDTILSIDEQATIDNKPMIVKNIMKFKSNELKIVYEIKKIGYSDKLKFFKISKRNEAFKLLKMMIIKEINFLNSYNVKILFQNKKYSSSRLKLFTDNLIVVINSTDINYFKFKRNNNLKIIQNRASPKIRLKYKKLIFEIIFSKERNFKNFLKKWGLKHK